jgi:flagellar biosynthesis protein FlhF
MRLKSYFARDVKSALALAEQELGPDAMLVDSKKAPPEARHLGEFEVVVAAGVPDAPAPVEAPRAEAPAARGAPEPEPPSRMGAEIADIRRQVERMAAAVTRASLLVTAHTLPSAELAAAFAGLIENELEPSLAHDILNRIRERGVPPEAAALRRAVASELAGRFRVEARLGRGAGPRITALVGPCGAGKTSMIAKLAASHGLGARRPAQILSMDTYRVAASEQLRSYAAILGVGFQALETPSALAQALEECRGKGLVLIDTPGCGPADLYAAADLAGFLAGRDDIDTQLVLTASMRPADLSRVVDRFEMFRPQRLIFTRLDEAGAFGSLVNESVRTGKPISFLAAGQQVPEDFEPATAERITGLVAGGGAGAEAGTGVQRAA